MRRPCENPIYRAIRTLSPFFAPKTHQHAHDHDELYSAIDHNHDGVYSDISHNHDDRYYTESEVDALLSGLGGGGGGDCAFSIALTSDFSADPGWQKVHWPALADFDYWVGYDEFTFSYTIPKGGHWLVRSNAYLSNLAASTNCFLASKRGVDYIDLDYKKCPLASTDVSLAINRSFYFSVGDEISVEVYHNYSTARYVKGDAGKLYTWWQMEYKGIPT